MPSGALIEVQPLEPLKDLRVGEEDHLEKPGDHRGVGGISDEDQRAANPVIDDAGPATSGRLGSGEGEQEAGAPTPQGLGGDGDKEVDGLGGSARGDEDQFGAGDRGEAVEPASDRSNDRLWGHGSGDTAPQA